MRKSLLLSNVNIAIIHRLLDAERFEIGDGYNQWISYFLQEHAIQSTNENDLLHEKYDCIFVILDGVQLRQDYPEVDEAVELIKRVGPYAKRAFGTKIYISTIVCIRGYVINPTESMQAERYAFYLNEAIYQLSQEEENIYVLPVKDYLSVMGTETSFLLKTWYLSSSPYSINACKKLAELIDSYARIGEMARKKCIVVDLDNTLWGGAIGEEGVDGIELSNHKEGARFYDFQCRLKEIKETGVILCIASKNNEEDVKPAFSSRNMLLQENDFVIKKINWNAKSQSIQEIAQELNIGLDAIVFIDDNPIEREEVKRALPMVTVPEFPTDTATLDQFAWQIYTDYFLTDKVLSEDSKKTDMYRANGERAKLRAMTLSMDDFIQSLEISIEISEANISDIARVSQMTKKTNQFNLTTRRYTEQDIAQMLADDKTHVYIGHVADRFGDNGVSILCIMRLNGERACIDEFLMSCRVMNRQIEYAFLRSIETRLSDDGVTMIDAEFIPTQKNAPAASFYAKYGFDALECESSSDVKRYEKNVIKHENETMYAIRWAEEV